MNIVDGLVASAAAHGDKVAIAYEDRGLTYRQLEERVRSVASSKRGWGLGRLVRRHSEASLKSGCGSPSCEICLWT